MSDAGDGEFADYVAARHTALLRRAYLLTGNQADAEDLVQTTLAKTYRAWGRIRDREAVDAYVRRTMVNTRRSWLRRPFRETPTDALPEPRARDGMPDVGQRDVLRRVLMELPAKQRAAVVLRYYEDLSEQETAEVLGVSVGTVKSSVSRALARLRTDPQLQSRGPSYDPMRACP